MKDSPEFNIFFVSLIEKHRSIYDFSHPDYFNKSKQDSDWETVAHKVDEPECKERWKNLRACYSRHKKSLTYPSANGPRFRKPYYLAEHLQFIDQFTKTRTPKDTSYKSEPQSSESANFEFNPLLEMKDQSEESDEGNMMYEIDIKEEPGQNFESPPAKRIKEDVVSVDGKCVSSQTENESADLSFLKSLLPDMVEMNGTQKRRFKLGILNLAHKILDQYNLD